jgi:hypothetical protein
VRRFFFSGWAALAGCASGLATSGSDDGGADAIALAFASSASSSASSSWARVRSMRSELAPNFSRAEPGDLRFQLLDRQLRDDKAILGCRQLGDPGCQLRVPGDEQPLQRGDVVRELSESADSSARFRGMSTPRTG